MALTQVLLIRHAETTDGGVARCRGWSDVPLSIRGKNQAGLLSRYLATYPISAMYCSDLRRTHGTAEILAHNQSARVTPLDELREINFGDLEGCPVEEVPVRFPDTFAAWSEHPEKCVFPNGEAFTAVKARVLPVVEALIEAHAGQTIALVLHSGVNRIILTWALGLDESHMLRLDQDHACLNILEFGGRAPLLKLLNFTVWKTGLLDDQADEGLSI